MAMFVLMESVVNDLLWPVVIVKAMFVIV